jgi:glycosyltransferase involved in cell wall biosynthesis
MTVRPTLALLIPAFNATHWLPRLLESAAGQTEPFDEIWVYDDCSADDTAAVAERYGARLVRGAVNRGCSCGKNALAARTQADWLHFHDADDALLPNFVALARKWMADGRFDVVLFDYEWREDDTGELLAVRHFDASDLARDPRSYALRVQINPFCGLYRREAFLSAGGYDEDPLVLYNEDVAVHIRLAFAGLSFAAESDVSIINYRRSDSMSASNHLKCIQAQYHVMRKLASHRDAAPYSREIAVSLWGAAAGLASHLDWCAADRAALLAMQLAGPALAPSREHFRALCRLSPRLALRVREGLIRMFKPQYRERYPGWRSPFKLAQSARK